MPPFQWEDIDHILVGLKLTNLAEEMHRQIEGDERRIHAENLRNLNNVAVPSLVLEMKERRTEEFAQRVYDVYCGVWQTQGHAKSAVFLRAVYGGGILPALRARGGAIASEFARVAGRANFSSQVRNANLEGLRARMHRLEDRWRRRIEAEAKECEHIERSRASVQPVSTKPAEPHYSTPLSTFEVRVGQLMVQARMACPGKKLPQAEIVKIANFLDDEKLPVRSNLERAAARMLAEYNQRHPTAAIKSWKAALSHPQFRRAARKRLSRAEEKCKKLTPPVVVLSAGTSRTTI